MRHRHKFSKFIKRGPVGRVCLHRFVNAVKRLERDVRVTGGEPGTLMTEQH